MSAGRLKSSPMFVVAVGALVVGLAAPAAAHEASHVINGKTIRNHTITGVKLKGNTLTGKQINESTLSTVPKARTLSPLTWHAVKFENGWGNYYAEVRRAAYAVDAQGIVHLRGVITGGTANAVAFTLPASVVPTAASGVSINLLALATGNKVAALIIASSGATPQANVNTSTSDVSNFFSLEGLTFSAAG